MFGWAVTFLIIALIAGVLGFGGVAIISIEMAKIIFIVALILFLASVIVGLLRGRSTPMAYCGRVLARFFGPRRTHRISASTVHIVSSNLHLSRTP